ncbi:MAG TPA: VOC family protein [Chryseolinea sp.]|nr:VOC family protein [Chryseolinea sp.]
MTTFNIYLNFNGNTEEAFNFYKSVLGGEIVMIQRFKETPEAGQTPPADQDKIMHIAMSVGKNMMFMGTDALVSKGHKVVMGNNFQISVSTESEDETRKIFNDLSAGGKVDVPLDKMFWGAYFGMLTDKFGVQWMVSYDAARN